MFLTPTSYTETSGEFDTFTLGVSSNVSWTVSVSYGSGNGWVSFNPSSGTNSDDIFVEIYGNTTPYPRSATITVSGGGYNRTCSITQYGNPYI